MNPRFLHLVPAPRPGREQSSGAEPSWQEPAQLLMGALGGLLVDRPAETISLEICADGGEVTFVVGAPEDLQEAVVNNLYAAYPSGNVKRLADWPLLAGSGETAGLDVSFGPDDGCLRHDSLAHADILNPLFEVLSAVPEDGQLVVQLVLRASRPKALMRRMVADVWQGLLEEGGRMITGVAAARQDDPAAAQDESEPSKAEAAMFRANLRLAAQAASRPQARAILEQATATFQQYCLPGKTKLLVRHPRRPDPWLRRLNQRQAVPAGAFLLTPDEAANLYHLPAEPQAFPAIRRLPAVQLAPHASNPTSRAASPKTNGDLLVGYSCYRDGSQPVVISAADRLRHLYVIGQTGSGKSTLLQSAMLQDVAAGEGCCFIDPHGDAIDWLLQRIPKERLGDVVLFDPSDHRALLGLNLLEWQTPYERDLLVQELIHLFYKLFDPEHTGIIGPQFEHWLRSAALTITEPKVRGTLVDIPRLFTDIQFQQAVIPLVEHPAARDFWHNQMAQTAAFHKSEMLNYFTSKFGSFLGNSTMHHILSQRHSAFQLRALMDNRKILLVNLSKGKLGSLNAELLGSLLVTKLQMAALSRADVPPAARPPFYVYIDEFHNLATDSFAGMLSEVRKYGVGLHLAHQYVEQLSPSIRQAVTGNVGTMVAFRVGRNDAEALKMHFSPLNPDDLTDIAPFQYHIRLLHQGVLSKPFTARPPRVERQPQPVLEQVIRSRLHAYVAAIPGQHPS